jgi:hypothetical protein
LVEEAAEKASDLGGSHGQMAEEFIDQLFVLSEAKFSKSCLAAFPLKSPRA